MKSNEWSAIASVISAFIALISAIIALISVMYQIKTQKKLDDDKHNMARAIFIVNGVSSTGYKLDISVANKGNIAVSDINVSWKGNVNSENVNCEIEYPKGKDFENYEFKIITNWEKNKIKENIEGNIVISYKNIYGKEQSCKYPVKIEKNCVVKDCFKGGYFTEC